jgi:hypothetical protein
MAAPNPDHNAMPLSSKFLFLFVQGVFGTMRHAVIELLLLVSALAYCLLRFGTSPTVLKEHLWEVLFPWVIALCIVVMWHSIDSAIKLGAEIRRNAAAMLQVAGSVLLASGTPSVVKISAPRPPRLFHVKIWGIAGVLMGTALLLPTLAGLMARKEATEPFLTSDTAFSVDIEAKFTSFEQHITGFWVKQGPNVYASNLVIFLRITNAQKNRTMISRYSVDEYDHPAHQCKIEMLETITGRVFYIPPKGSPPTAVGRTLQFPANNTGTYLLNFKPEDSDMAHAVPLNLNNMDALLSSKYIEPLEPIRGWSFFQCQCFFPTVIVIHLTDILGHEFSYKVEHSNKMETGDTMMRLMTLESPVDLSDSVRHIFLAH